MKTPSIKKMAQDIRKQKSLPMKEIKKPKAIVQKARTARIK